MDVFEAIEKRYSVRGYKPDAVEDEKLRQGAGGGAAGADRRQQAAVPHARRAHGGQGRGTGAACTAAAGSPRRRS